MMRPSARPRSLVVSGGGGDDVIGVDDSRPGGDAQVDSGAGNDSVSMNTGAGGTLNVQTAGSDDFLFLDGIETHERVVATTGDGSDEFFLCCSFLFGDTTLRTNGGPDSFSVQGVTFEGPTEIHGGASTDTFTDLGDNFFNGPLTITSFENVVVVPPPE